ncbi:hypothetical protein RM531_03145 [Salinisphaera sp. P385]|uniref:DUF2946 domain-containing protein n=1 Tax=Spectribacter acetivorans TaxID=3075603 RepID=A0ABU3B4S5_9GAMM|nr:hypothetical protein [Salinisphaera sp. P385]MDT0617456.1 hypothetical protein [Salinisphaera sp. P385]
MRQFIRQFPRQANAVHWLVAIMLGVSALAWAWHVDMPVPADETVQVADSHAHSDSGDLVDRCDHCCHAGAHLVALTPSHITAAFESTSTYTLATAPALTPPQTSPPFIPPIA